MLSSVYKPEPESLSDFRSFNSEIHDSRKTDVRSKHLLQGSLHADIRNQESKPRRRKERKQDQDTRPRREETEWDTDEHRLTRIRVLQRGESPP
ncbi:MAG: hypothetical protein DMG06_17740 [Acidobacteria bacterium]|nr:MAG: hypothetical protein DMG06_17740 [Acidobacteriota bacterium]